MSNLREESANLEHGSRRVERDARRDGGYGANFVVRSEDAELAQRTGSELADKLRAAGYDPVEGGL
ncbi:MAG TPA: hypothetical protein VN106_09065 [Sphingomicrobium sp.]|nr:hypothetical protein [Sphingomicrobium sp.]